MCGAIAGRSGPCFTRPWVIAARGARKPREVSEPLDFIHGNGLARGAPAGSTPGLAPPEPDIVDKGAYTGRVGYTHPTAAAGLRPTPFKSSGLEPRALPLAIPERRPAPESRPGGPGRGAEGRRRLLWLMWGARPVGRLNPAGAPWRARPSASGLTRPPDHA